MRTLVTLVSILCCALPARADDRADAEALFRIGATAYKAGNFAAASANFDRAYALYNAPEIAFSAAQAHRLQYQADKDPAHVKRAIALFEAYVAATPEGGKRKDALAHLARLRDTLRDLESSGQPAVAVVSEPPSIYVSVALENALVTIDGKAADRYTGVEVAAGEHVVEVSAEGYEKVVRKVTVVEGKGRVIVPIELAALPAMVSIQTTPGAHLEIDGRPTALSAITPIPAGKRLLSLSARGREPVTRELELRPGQELQLAIPLRTTARRRAVPWVVIGDGVLAAATLTTAFLSIRADGKAADLRDARTPLSTPEAADYERQRRRRDNFRTASLVFGAATLATAGTALWMYYFDHPAPDELARPVEKPGAGGFSPVVFGDGAGLSYAGGF